MSKILVTGGAGFIGAHTTVELINRGDEVVIIDDFNDRYDPELKELRIANLFKDIETPKIIRGSITDLDLIEETFNSEKFNSVIHLAAWAAVPTSIEKPHVYVEANINGTVNILETARKHDIKNIVFASSSSVYGGREDMPLKETDDVTRPISPYAATKASGELMCATWHHLYEIPVSCLRFFTVYGPWGRPEMAMFIFADAILNNKTIQMRGKNTQRDFTYIDDCVQGVIASHDNPQGFEIFNLGESDAVPLPKLISTLENTFNKKAHVEEVPLPESDVPMTLADISKAQKMIGYNPTTKIEAGVEKFAKWYQDWFIPNYLNK